MGLNRTQIPRRGVDHQGHIANQFKANQTNTSFEFLLKSGIKRLSKFWSSSTPFTHHVRSNKTTKPKLLPNANIPTQLLRHPEEWQCYAICIETRLYLCMTEGSTDRTCNTRAGSSIFNQGTFIFKIS